MSTMQGTITSLKREKTATVEVTRMWQHPVFKKSVKRSKKYACQYDEAMKLVEGDVVEIESCRPVSKTKRFRIVNKVDKK